MTIKHRAQRESAAILSAMLMLSLAACQADDKHAGTSGAASSATESLDEFVRLFSGSEADYEPAPNPQALAKTCALVVTGRITDVIPGRTIMTSNMVTFVVRVDEELTEAAAPAVVHVEMHIPGSLPATEVSKSVPRDLQVAFFLNEAPTAADLPIADERAGRPAGMPLYSPYNPQSFWVAEPGRVLQPLEQKEFQNVDITEFLPPAEDYPPSVLSPGRGD